MKKSMNSFDYSGLPKKKGHTAIIIANWHAKFYTNVLSDNHAMIKLWRYECNDFPIGCLLCFFNPTYESAASTRSRLCWEAKTIYPINWFIAVVAFQTPAPRHGAHHCLLLATSPRNLVTEFDLLSTKFLAYQAAVDVTCVSLPSISFIKFWQNRMACLTDSHTCSKI